MKKSLSAFFVFMLLPALGQANDLIPMEAPIVPDSKVADTNRYYSSKNWDDTLLFYRRFFKRRGGVRWKSVIHSPTVKAKHIQNLRKKGYWDGINIYEHNGIVSLYVLERDRAAIDAEIKSQQQLLKKKAQNRKQRRKRKNHR